MSPGKIHQLFPFGIGMFAVAGIIIFFSMNRMVNENAERETVAAYQSELEGLRVDFRKAIIEQRDYLLTRKRMHLIGYYAHRATALNDINGLRRSYTGFKNPVVDNVEEVFNLIETNFELMDSTVLYHMRNDSLNMASTISRTNKAYNEIASLVEELDRNLIRSMESGMQSVNKTVKIVERMMIVLYLLGFLLLFINYRFLQKEIKGRIVAEKKVSLQAQRLRDLNATKDKLFSIIAHDLRSPLSHLFGFSSLIKDKLADTGSPELEKISTGIHQSTKNAINLLENLLKWSQLQTGSLVISPEKFDLHEAVEEAVSLYAPQAEMKQLKVANHLKPCSWTYSDKHIVQTVLRNLINNAIKFSFPESEILINATRVNGRWQVSVKDHGIGMKPETLDKIFRIDEKYTTRGTAQEQGTGIGLMLCKELIEKNEGELWVHSAPNEGSEFFFTTRYLQSAN